MLSVFRSGETADGGLWWVVTNMSLVPGEFGWRNGGQPLLKHSNEKRARRLRPSIVDGNRNIARVAASSRAAPGPIREIRFRQICGKRAQVPKKYILNNKLIIKFN